jgi:CHAD domain-containing protein
MDSDPALRLLAATFIRRQAKQLGDQLDGLRAAEDIEYVHRARVAARRLRAAFRLFHDCLGARRTGRWQKAIRRITSALGDARDRDVQIDFLCGILSALSAKECFPGIAHILVELEHDREQLQRTVIQAVKRLRDKKVLQEMRRKGKRVRKNLRSMRDSAPTPQVLARIEYHVCKQLQELLDQQDSLRDPDNRAGHHAMRIAAKRLRYTLEIARPVYPEQLEETIAAVKKVQTMLGDIHDCDVWWDFLGQFASAERDRILAMFGQAGRFVRQQAGIEYLQRDRHHHRQQVFDDLVKYWAELGDRRLWDRLTATVRKWGEPPATVGAPAPTTPQHAESPANGNGSGSEHPPAANPLLTTGS